MRGFIFYPYPSRDYAEQLVKATKGNGLVYAKAFMPCACEPYTWVGVGPIAREVLTHKDLEWLADVKWVHRLGFEADLFLRNATKVRVIASKLNDIDPLPEPTGVTEDAVKFYVFTCIYRFIAPHARLEAIYASYAKAKDGLGHLGEFFRPRWVEDAFRRGDDEALQTGLIEMALNPKTQIAYGNILRSVAWCLHHMLELGLEKVDMTFVREVMRVHPPNEWPSRRAKADVQIGGELIKQGETVYASLRATNLAMGGPFAWPPRAEGQMVFGAGKHRCPVRGFSEKIVLMLVNGPGVRPLMSTAGVNQPMPVQIWPQP